MKSVMILSHWDVSDHRWDSFPSHPDIRRVQCVDQRVKGFITSSWMTRTDREKHTHVETWTEHPRQDQLTSVTAEEKISMFCGNYQENAPMFGIVLILCVILWFNYRNVSHFYGKMYFSASLFWRWWQMFLFICLYVWSKCTNKNSDVMVLLTEVKLYIRDSLKK